MPHNLLNTIQYWRANKLDSSHPVGRLTKSACSKMEVIEGEDAEVFLKTGRFPEALGRKLKGMARRNKRNVGCVIYPRIYFASSAHIREIDEDTGEATIATRDGFQSGERRVLDYCIAPVSLVAKVNEKGDLKVDDLFAGRDLLAPLDGAETYGDISALLDFKAGLDLGKKSGWSEIASAFEEMFGSVFRGVDGFPGYVEKNVVLVSLEDVVVSRAQNELYETLVADIASGKEKGLGLLRSFTQVDKHPDKEYHHETSRMRLRLGAAGNAFPLADLQRNALGKLADMSNGEILAVNGPPGTGKTTMLLSGIAGAWVKAALDQADVPPITVATSANNQAIQNILDAFRKGFERVSGYETGENGKRTAVTQPIDRWLGEELNSFGVGYPAGSSKNDWAHKGFLVDDVYKDKIEQEPFVGKSKLIYQKRAREYFDLDSDKSVKQIVGLIHDEMCRVFSLLNEFSQAFVDVGVALEKYRSFDGDPAAVCLDLEESIESIEIEYRRLVDEINRWSALQAGFGPDWTRFFDLFGKRRRRIAADLQLFASTAEFVPLWKGELKHENAHEVSIFLAELSKKAKTELQRRNEKLASVKRLIQECQDSEERFGLVLNKVILENREFQGGDKPALDLSDTALNDPEWLADVLLRYRLMELATHYWEGRWLLDVEGKTSEEMSLSFKNGGYQSYEKKVAERWGRRMMLTPCAVATLAHLPKVMSFQTPKKNWRYLYGFADLLIMDEAGQVTPEDAGCAMALAKKSLVIGDTLQIEPVATLAQSIDRGNMVRSKLVLDEDDGEFVFSSGISSLDGSAMVLSQGASRYQQVPEMSRGLWLFEHRRCYDDIIQYCNDLCYKGHMVPKRGAANPSETTASGFSLPSMGFLNIPGMCETKSGGRQNLEEARVIASWLEHHQADILAAYEGSGKSLEELVAIVTPFRRQKEVLIKEVKKAGFKVGGEKGMVVGTVHALQGAEKRIVIFSPVYSKHANGGFIDQSTSLLNVAVSRAQDHFLVFGDLSTFSSGQARKPLGDLLLSNREKSELIYDIPARSDLIEKADGKPRMLVNSEGHDQFLRELLESNARKITIVSPFVIPGTLRKHGILVAMKVAREAGKEIEIVVDPTQSRNHEPAYRSNKTNLEETLEELSSIDVSVRKISRVHSKFLVADSNVLVNGSFNWMSARREPPYKNVETSTALLGEGLKDEIEVMLSSLEK